MCLCCGVPCAYCRDGIGSGESFFFQQANGAEVMRQISAQMRGCGVFKAASLPVSITYHFLLHLASDNLDSAMLTTE